MESLTAADPQVIGEFRLRARLGAGGMGQVFLATSPGGRMVAVKVIHSEFARDEEFVRRFRAEVDAARRVSGLYTAPVVAAGVDDRSPWLATAFVPGPSLDGLVRQYGPLPVPALWRLAAGLADALRAIHAAGLVHRDLKPANVLLASDGPRVIDFGIARALADSRLTATGSIIGTPSFMSPEQVEGAVTGPPSDVFSLGSVLAFAASGSSPFSGGPGVSSASVMYRIVHTLPELAMVPAEVRELVQACLAKEPMWRPDLGQVAARCAQAAEQLGLPPAIFWPSEVGRVIDAQQAVLAAQVQDIWVAAPAGVPAFPAGPAAMPARPPAGASWAGGQEAGRNLTAPARPGSSGPTGPWGPPRQPDWARDPGRTGPSARSGLTAGRIGRRALLIGGGAAAGVAAAGGVAAWLTSRPAPSAPPSASSQSGPAARGGTVHQVTSGSGGDGTGGTGPGSLAWTFTMGNIADSIPYVANGVVYVGNQDNFLHAVSATTGKQVWKSPVGDVHPAPELVGGMLCAVADGGQFSVLHPATGTVAWRLSSQVVPQPVRNWASAGSSVFLATTLQTPLNAYDAVTGSVRQSFGSAGQFWGGCFGVAGGVLYAMEELGALHAYSVSSGADLWDSSPNVGDPLIVRLIIDGGSIYLTTDDGTLYSFSAANGKQNWSYPTGGTDLSEPAVANGMVYTIDMNGTLHAINAASGKQAWSHSAEDGGDVGAAVANGTLYFSAGQSVQAVDAKTGRATWSYTPPKSVEFFTTPAVGNGLVFIGANDDSLYAIRA
jgi:outer membrane protein assembly factor BamB